MNIGKLYESQISLSEWFERIGHAKAAEHRAEDNEKRERLKVLARHIGLPYDAPTQFHARDLAAVSPEFQAFLSERGHELCALRLIPTDPALPKLRMRGKSINEVMGWFAEQDIDPERYRADFVPHAEDNIWSTIFVVSGQGIVGEITRGGHHELTQGFYAEPPFTFIFDFENWSWDKEDAEAQAQMQDIVSRLRVSDPATRERLARELNATFVGEYLDGYFETVTSNSFGLWFCDYNRMLGRSIGHVLPLFPPKADPPPADKGELEGVTVADSREPLLRGQCGSAGVATGRVRVVAPQQIDDAEFQDGDVLVCKMTTPAYIPLMQKASAIVTDQGGILSHAAIVARELGKPCVVATRNATSTLRDGDFVEVDGIHGIIN
jgi:phosphohistidine swiveling domain-containing protein